MFSNIPNVSNMKILITHCVKSVQIRSYFWSVFSHIRTEYGVIRSISPYSVLMQENTDQKELRIWTLLKQWIAISANINLFKANSENTRNRCGPEQSQCEICSKLTINMAQSKVTDDVLVSLFLAMNVVYTIF